MECASRAVCRVRGRCLQRPLGTPEPARACACLGPSSAPPSEVPKPWAEKGCCWADRAPGAETGPGRGRGGLTQELGSSEHSPFERPFAVKQEVVLRGQLLHVHVGLAPRCRGPRAGASPGARLGAGRGPPIATPPAPDLVTCPLGPAPALSPSRGRPTLTAPSGHRSGPGAPALGATPPHSQAVYVPDTLVFSRTTSTS